MTSNSAKGEVLAPDGRLQAQPDSYDWLLRRVVVQAAIDGWLAQPRIFATRMGLSYHTLTRLLRGPHSAHAASLRKLVMGLGFAEADREFLVNAGVDSALAALEQRRRERRGDQRRIRAARVQREGFWVASDESMLGLTALPDDTPADTERVVWIYLVGETGWGDAVLERRVSRAPRGGLRARVVGPGVVGRDAFLDNPAVLGFEAVVERVEPDARSMPRVSDLLDFRANPPRVHENATGHFARVRRASISPDLARVHTEFVPPIPAGAWVQWSLLYRWPRIWDSARLRVDDMSSRGRLNFGDADEGGVTVLVAPRSKDGDASSVNATGRLYGSLLVDAALPSARLAADRGRGLHALSWSATQPGRIQLELSFVDKGLLPSD
jgi:hypothetical protein